MLLDRTKWLRPAWPTGLTFGVVLSLLLSVCGESALAQGPGPNRTQPPAATPKPDDPKARALFDEITQAYKALSAYSDHGEFVQAMTINGKPQNQTTSLNLTLVRPNKVKIDVGPVQLISDGKSLVTSVGANLKKYTEQEAPKAISLDTFRQGPTGAILFGGAPGPATFVLLNYLTAVNPADAIKQLGGSLQPGDGNPEAPSFLIQLQDNFSLLLTADPKTKLLARIDMKIDPARLKETLQSGVTIEQFGWRSGAVSTNVAKDQSFAYLPPEGFKKVESLVERKPAQERKSAVHALLGKPAPDFTLTVLDGPGKTKTITKAELAGKVVVIDFWATWCPPCMLELPEVQKVIENYATSHKDVLVVALSQDREPEEISGIRTLVEKTLKEKKINLTGSPNGLIALDPSNSMSSAFNIEGLPTLVILDAKGIVRSAHVGFNPRSEVPFNKSLGKEIDTLLEGKSLDPHGDEGKVPAEAGK